MIKIFENIQIPSDRSIIVFANYRTGSTAFCDLLANLTGFKNYDELFNPWRQSKFSSVLQTPCIIKIMPNFVIPEEYVNIIEGSFKIGLSRRSTIDQIASFYICTKTQTWHMQKNDVVDNYQIDIDVENLENEIRYIIEMRQAYENSNIKKDLELYYEDLPTTIVESKFIRYVKPTNYNEIVQRIEQIINDVSDYSLT